MDYNFLKIEKPEATADTYKWLKRDFIVPSSVEKTVSKILKEVKICGDRAVIKFCKKFDGINIKKVDELKVKDEEIKRSHELVVKTYHLM